MENIKSVAIIGAGASGLMCAYALCNNPKFNITIFDTNFKIGQKILITGGGRCNVTNLCDPNQFLLNVCNNSKFLTSAINLFSPKDMVKLLSDHKVKTAIEQNNRVFPFSNKASSITNMFESVIETASNISLKLGTKVTNIAKVGNGFEVEYNGTYKPFDVVIVATGGQSYPTTGSHGEGYKFAKKPWCCNYQNKTSLVRNKIKRKFKKFRGCFV